MADEKKKTPLRRKRKRSPKRRPRKNPPQRPAGEKPARPRIKRRRRPRRPAKPRLQPTPTAEAPKPAGAPVAVPRRAPPNCWARTRGKKIVKAKAPRTSSPASPTSGDVQQHTRQHYRRAWQCHRLVQRGPGRIQGFAQEQAYAAQQVAQDAARQAMSHG